MTELQFTKTFTQKEAIPEKRIELENNMLKTGLLQRYNLVPNEESQASILETEFAKRQAVDFCLACRSGG